MIIKITKLVGTPPHKEESPPVWVSGVKVIRLRSGHVRMFLQTQTGKKMVDIPPGCEIEMEANTG